MSTLIINLPTKDIRVTNISKSFTYKMAAETSWHRYGTKLRHCHPMYKFIFQNAISILVISDHNSFRVLFDKIASVYYI